VETLSLLYVPPAKGGGMEIFMKKVLARIKVFVLIAFIWIYSGSLFYMSANLALQICIIPIFLILLYFVDKRRGLRMFIKIRDKNCILFLYLYALSMIVNFVVASSITQFALYFLFELFIMVCAYFIAITNNYREFINTYIDVITVVAITSIICWFLPDFIKNIAFMHYTRGNWTFASILFYNLNLSVQARNCGPFWEPGMFQAFLNFALLMMVFSEKRKGNIVRACILVFAVITTFSSTGYFLLVCMTIMKLLQTDMNAKRIAAIAVITIGGVILISNLSMLLFYIDQYTLYSVSAKFLNGGNVSVTTRLYSGLCDLRVAITHPFGANRAALDTIRQQYALDYGAVSASTSTLTAIFTYFGWSIGIMYLYLWIKGCCRIQTNLLNRILLIVFMVVILMSELHIDLLFFNIILFFWNSRYNTKEVYEMRELITKRISCIE